MARSKKNKTQRELQAEKKWNNLRSKLNREFKKGTSGNYAPNFLNNAKEKKEQAWQDFLRKELRTTSTSKQDFIKNYSPKKKLMNQDLRKLGGAVSSSGEYLSEHDLRQNKREVSREIKVIKEIKNPYKNKASEAYDKFNEEKESRIKELENFLQEATTKNDVISSRKRASELAANQTEIAKNIEAAEQGEVRPLSTNWEDNNLEQLKIQGLAKYGSDDPIDWVNDSDWRQMFSWLEDQSRYDEELYEEW